MHWGAQHTRTGGKGLAVHCGCGVTPVRIQAKDVAGCQTIGLEDDRILRA